MNEFGNFGELPQSLVLDVFKQTDRIKPQLLQSFEEWRMEREEWRDQLVRKKLLKHELQLPSAPNPTTCGVDGAYATESLMVTDVVVAGAVAVEGFTPPSEKSFWPDPKHFVHIETEPHNTKTETDSILRTVMMGMELMLAQQAPHDLVLLDGSFTTPIISFNQGFSNAKKNPHLKTVREYLVKKIKCFLDAYHEVLTSSRADRQWVAVPKYTSSREISEKLKRCSSYDDRGLLSYILDAGEYTNPIRLKQPTQPWHLGISVIDPFTTTAERNKIKEQVEQITQSLSNLCVLYYRPRAYMPALRLEIKPSIANNEHRLSIVLQGIKDQYGKAAIMEPYPLYMADRMIKHLPQAIPACLHGISNHLAENYQGNINDVFVGLHSYRTE